MKFLLVSSLITSSILASYALATPRPAGDTCSSNKVAAAERADLVDVASSAGSFKTLVAAVQAAGLVDTLKGKGPFTVFAPTDEAFAKLPKGTVENLLKQENRQQLIDLLTYHVVPSNVPASAALKADFADTVLGQALRLESAEVADGMRVLTVDGARVVKTDVQASNGVIHVIDSVLMPRANLIQTAAQAGSFQTLLAAAKAAGLVEALSGKEPLTVFAPTDDAFAKLPAGTVESLLKPENKDQLAAVLTYHVVPGRLLAKDVLQVKALATLNGKSALIAMDEHGARIGAAHIVKTDVLAGNGVIHVIDSVLLP